MSDAPEKKQGRIAEIRQAYRAIKSLDPRLGWWMLGVALATAAVIIAVGAVIGGGWLWYGVIVAVPSALLAATVVMNRRGNTAMYNALEGQVGAAGAALTGMGKRGWYAAQEPVAMDGARGTRPQDMVGAAMVFRALGRPGIVLIGEGPAGRVARLLKQEEKKVARVAPGVPVHLWTVGDGADQVPVRKLSGKLTKMRPVLTKAEVAVVNKRLTSLGGLRPPIPKGVDPTKVRMDRKAMRGR
ncbi:DUF4191 domain-containing protein [Phycicoccus endophyticus]|uniref:DUF4191 domain-containing protein n=1 Tax=Phycicoccus endophyticus TaxID=1690220 RepID=A0A7G9R522_9MICO|nr:DUF4191 domain-containing protein [Phycicoccus endophyticus]NHI20882.1 DUF4191 family protein [Phycicoccus endophyticus]QNN50697.1 DUF4191 domain-containing protein [Phycicoccus endophyticus]GGL22206.1 hypothetical protein GCM10012283_00350 [Phycicoccus endophyticus]